MHLQRQQKLSTREVYYIPRALLASAEARIATTVSATEPAAVSAAYVWLVVLGAVAAILHDLVATLILLALVAVAVEAVVGSGSVAAAGGAAAVAGAIRG